MHEELLIERIRNLELKGSTGSERNQPDVLRSIINHLQRLLNTRQGSVPIADDYGMPEFVNFQGGNFSETAQNIANEIGRIIPKYEPRLEGVRVTYVPDASDFLSLQFKIQADIVHVRGKTFSVELKTTINSDGKINVTE
jgi:type VI secretion system protein